MRASERGIPWGGLRRGRGRCWGCRTPTGGLFCSAWDIPPIVRSPRFASRIGGPSPRSSTAGGGESGGGRDRDGDGDRGGGGSDILRAVGHKGSGGQSHGRGPPQWRAPPPTPGHGV